MVVEVGPPPAEVAVAGEGADEGEPVLRVAVVVDRPVVVVRVRVVVHGRGRLVAVVRPAMAELIVGSMFVRWCGSAPYVKILRFEVDPATPVTGTTSST